MSDQPQQQTISNELLTELIQVGVILGHHKSKTHPKMRAHIAGNRNELELLDPASVLESIEEAGAFLKKLLGAPTAELPNEQGTGLVLVVGTEPAVKERLAAFAESWKQPFVGRRWLGGTLTNFSMIRSRLKYYDDLKTKREQGELQKYTKREQLEFDKEIAKLSATFDGLARLTKLPDVLFVVDAKSHATAIAEAKILKIPVIAIMDSDDDPSTVAYPIIANDHARASIQWVLGQLERVIQEQEHPVGQAVGVL
ncbi:MAG: 30S ribosomal protein S2 [bacterium]|nr:30S ribosomal protein S2 [bacterium]